MRTSQGNSLLKSDYLEKKKEERKFQQFVNMKYKLGELLYPVEVMNSVYDKDIAKQTICAVL